MQDALFLAAVVVGTPLIAWGVSAAVDKITEKVSSVFNKED